MVKLSRFFNGGLHARGSQAGRGDQRRASLTKEPQKPPEKSVTGIKDRMVENTRSVLIVRHRSVGFWEDRNFGILQSPPSYYSQKVFCSVTNEGFSRPALTRRVSPVRSTRPSQQHTQGIPSAFGLVLRSNRGHGCCPRAYAEPNIFLAGAPAVLGHIIEIEQVRTCQ